MRYDINHVLEGIQAHRAERIEQLQVRTTNVEVETTELYQAAERKSSEVLSTITELTVRVEQQNFMFHEDVQELVNALLAVRSDAPSQWKVERNERAIKANGEQITRMNQQYARRDADVEVFLRGLQAGGETHVSQYALTQAGFKANNIAQYVVAYGRTSKEA